MASTTESTPASAVHFSADNEYFETRKKYFEQREKEKGILTYPHKFETTTTVKAFLKEWKDLVNSEIGHKVEAVAGRVVSWRQQSKKLIFFDLRNDGSTVQVMLNAKEFKGDFEDIVKSVNRFDIVGVSGYALRTKTGELSILAQNMQLLSPCLRMLPQQGLTDQEIRYRKRHVDGIVNHAEFRRIMEIRTTIIKYIRNFFDERGFLEVETPMVGLIAGGAAARPFFTRINATKQDAVMRISPELALKELVVAGFEKVYELGRQFRNEGLDSVHNPEFTSIESYQSFVDYHDLMTMTEELLSGLVFKLKGSYKFTAVPFAGEDRGPREVDFTPPFQRIPLIAGLEKEFNVKIPRPYDSDECNAFLVQLCKDHNIDVTPPMTTTRVLDTLVGNFLETKCINPTFIIDHPQVMSPLAKWHRDDPQLTERFEMFVTEKELVNSYTELNSPHVQRDCFASQLKDKNAGDDEAQMVDWTFIDSLDCALAPTGGWGMGIDRLVMLLTGVSNIKEVLMMPMMRPLKD